MNHRASLAEIHHDASQYAISNKTLLDMPWRGSYLVGTKSKISNDITIDPTVAIAVKDTGVQAMYYGQTEFHTNTRTEIQNGKVKMGDDRLLAVGGVVHLQDEDGFGGIPLHTRNGKLPMSGKVTQPSGLASELPVKAAWLRINEEFGGVYVHHHTKTIEVLVIEPDAATLRAHPELMEDIKKQKRNNEHHIRREVGKIYPSTLRTKLNEEGHLVETWNVAITPVKSQAITTDHAALGRALDTITINHPRGQDVITGMAFDEPARGTMNINLLISAQLPGPFETLKLIDMEGYGREARMYSPEEIAELGDNATPALRNFGERLTKAIGQQPPAPAAAPAAAPLPPR